MDQQWRRSNVPPPWESAVDAVLENIDIVFFFVLLFQTKKHVVTLQRGTKNSQTISMEIPWEAAAIC